MITINHISFDFIMTDEQFAQRMYADWDNFCYACFEKVVEQCLSPYDRDKVLREIETLDLDLGNIPEEDFFQEFPRRLKEELLKVLPLFNVSAEGQEEKTRISRLENLLFCLEYGYPKTEWADSDFSLEEELEWAVSLFANEIARLCLRKEHALRRLLWQTDDETVLLRIFIATLSEPSSGLHEKHRFLGILLEVKPDIPVRFIHEATDDVELGYMAELLDTLFIYRIMETEAEEHAEVDLPPYWHYLYEWLVKYYPFNGLSIFGDKGDFIRHLHHRFLTFIRKRNYSFYLSKAELTSSFLIEVFGDAYYIEVLNVIYNLQPRHADGSPMYDGYLNMELYNIFSQLSLLRMPASDDQKRSRKDKWRVIGGGKKENAETLLIESIMTKKTSISQLIQGMARTDFHQASILSQTVEWLQQKADGLAFLTGNNMLLTTALTEALSLYMQDEDTLGGRALTESEMIQKFLTHLYFVYTGKTDYQDSTEWTNLSGEITADLRTEGWQEIQKEEIADVLLPEDIENLLKAENVPLTRGQLETPEYLFVGNSGLCLLSPWLPQLFRIVGYLGEDRRSFKDTESSIRAIFLLQYLTCLEEKSYQETELAFNRLLAAVPMHIPLPKQLKLTDEEKKVGESLLTGVKANWTKMRGTSMIGFQLSFILRTGRLTQQDEKWLLTVDDRGLDILLDSVPWSFKQIRFPWLKKYIQVVWHEKQRF